MEQYFKMRFDFMNKNANLIHLLESFVLSALLGFFLFFMKRGEGLFFPLTIGFSVFAFLFLLLMIYIDGDKPDRVRCGLIPIARSDLAFYGLLAEFALTAALSVVHNLLDLSIAFAVTLYSLPIIAMLLLILIPAPKDAPPPAATNEKSVLKAKSLDYYAAQFRKLIPKCEYQSLSDAMEKLAGLLSAIDPEFSIQLDALENDISNKCVKIENALLTHNTTQQALLERELSTTVELIEKRVESYKYCLTTEGFYHVDDEIAMAQIDKLLDKLGLEYEDDLPSLSAPFEDEFYYRKALRFASEEYAALLASYNAQIVERLKKEEADRVLRASKHQSCLQKVSHLLSVVFVAALAGITLFWHTSLQPQGLMLKENEDGTLTLTGYNPIYGDELVLPESVKGKQITVIGEEALMDSSLRSLELPEGVHTIEYQAMVQCGELETLILPKSLATIGNYAFHSDDSLTRVCYRGSEEEWKQVTVGNLGNDEFYEIEVEFDYQG